MEAEPVESTSRVDCCGHCKLDQESESKCIDMRLQDVMGTRLVDTMI